MKNLSFETCVRLKDAGFPQPERAPGQLWYCREDLCVLYRVAPNDILGASLEGSAHYGTNNPDDWVYCPTALELLSTLFDWKLVPIADTVSEWWSIGKVSGNMSYIEPSGTIAERIARIWLSENEQK